MLGYIFAKIKCKLYCVWGKDQDSREKLIMKKFFQSKGMSIGNNCAIYSNICSSETWLISIGDNVTISNDVQFITHDNSIDRFSEKYCDIFGKIEIGNNCFIGAHSLILPGVTLGAKTLVAAGSVVTKSFDGGIIAGNPAKKISEIEPFVEKYSKIAFTGKEYINGKKVATENNKNKILQNR